MVEGKGKNGLIFQFIFRRRTYNNTVIKRYKHSESGAGIKKDYETLKQPALRELRKECILCPEVEIV